MLCKIDAADKNMMDTWCRKSGTQVLLDNTQQVDFILIFGIQINMLGKIIFFYKYARS
jgi:hypothetical protein